MNMKQYETFELRFGGEALPYAWAQIDLTATFSCAQESLTVKGFYDGESDGRGVYVVRFLPQYAGVYRYQVRGAVTAEGEIVCEASSPEAHGIVRAVGTHFAFADGAPYIPFGTTVYALISQDDARWADDARHAPQQAEVCHSGDFRPRGDFDAPGCSVAGGAGPADVRAV